MYSKGGSAVSCPGGTTMSEQQQQRGSRAPAPLCKQNSWSPDTQRDEAWLKRKGNHHRLPRGRSKSVTDEDLDELRACFELGFGFDSPDLDPKLSQTFPALEFYYAVNRQYCSRRLSRSSSSSTVCSDSDSSTTSFTDSPSSSSIIDPSDEPETIKMRLRQWAQVVACSVRQSSPK